MSDVIWQERPRLRKPVLVCAFKGWNDAGEAASAALSFIRGSFEAHDVAQIDPEEYYDFTAVRPTVKLTEGHQREMDWPDNSFAVAEIQGADRDLIILEGVEPSLRWRRFTDTLIDAARELDVSMIITLGALLADVPHSRPVSITGIGSTAALVERLGYDPPSYEGPTGIVGVLQNAFAEAGVDSVSLWASVPHYVAASPNPKVALALVRGFEGIAGVAVDAAELESAAEDYERQVSAAVASDPEVKAFVERLETAADEVEAENPPDEESLPSADTIARDFQRFLRQRGPEDPNSGA
jgi:proteasome assembly chaperone (PAC2) family protein